jgi:beta-lactam-binding protein with PASTA domain/tRNA A-37 threonylcarbamoyl transferase component Bud32
VQQEQLLNNRYRVDGLLGNGGMAIVYVGTDTLLRRRVAIKVLRDQYASDDDFVQRFSYEAQAAAKLSHPNIVNVYDFGRADNAYYIVMELVDGATLADLLRDERVLPEPAAVDYAIQIASGLAYAHRQGLLHRDVKPANILVTTDDVVKLSDFGIARAVSAHTLGVTQPGMVMGSVAYLSPEQAQNHPLDERSDLYAVGVVLYQMLTGTLPFTGDTPVAVALKQVAEPAPPIDPIATGVSPALCAIVARLLRKAPDERYASATELASALREARERPHATQDFVFPESPAGRVAPPQPKPRRPHAPDRRDGVEVTDPPPPAFERRWVILAGLLVAAIAIGFFAMGGGGVFGPLATIVVPDLSGKDSNDAREALFRLGLRWTVTNESSETVAQDHVIRQDPTPGGKLAHDGIVGLVVSDGLPRVQIPDLTGYAVADAQRSLQNAKLQTTLKEAYDRTVPAGQVVSLDPRVGSQVHEGETITLTVSKGAQPIVVPNVVNMNIDDARRLLGAKGLSVTVGPPTSSDTVPDNMVATQVPSPGATVAPRSAVTVAVSTGAVALSVPDVVGQEPDAGLAALRAAGFTAQLAYNVDAGNASGKIAMQSPDGGTQAKKGSLITVYVNVPGSVPDVSGMSLADAEKALRAEGYQIGNIAYTAEGGVQPGQVVRTEPEANSPLRPGESINLTVLQGGPPGAGQPHQPQSQP